MYKLCAFDLDGTLINTIADIAAAVNYGLRELGYPEHSESEYYHMVGNGMRKICERALPCENKDRTDELIAIYGARYVEHCCDLSRPYADIPELLHRLSDADISLAVVTNKPQNQSDRVVSTFLSEFSFIEVLGQSDRFPSKPAPDMLRHVIERFGFLEGETLYIGDSNVDVDFAHAAFVPCAGAAWGFRGRDELERSGAEFVVEKASEIAEIVLTAESR
ncbi:MAG: HAD family hydrolase [Oscillospiraceae bacterium]